MFTLNQSSRRKRGEEHDCGAACQPDKVLSSATDDRAGSHHTCATTYIVSQAKLVKKLLKALMDRGANGSILGGDVRIIDVYDTCIDLNGIDDHTVRNLQLGTGVAFIHTDHGPIIGYLHQGAIMRDGKTILSPGQMEHFGCQVHDKAKGITGTDPFFQSPEGFKVPMAMRGGLPYVQITN